MMPNPERLCLGACHRLPSLVGGQTFFPSSFPHPILHGFDQIRYEAKANTTKAIEAQANDRARLWNGSGTGRTKGQRGIGPRRTTQTRDGRGSRGKSESVNRDRNGTVFHGGAIKTYAGMRESQSTRDSESMGQSIPSSKHRNRSQAHGVV